MKKSSRLEGDGEMKKEVAVKRNFDSPLGSLIENQNMKVRGCIEDGRWEGERLGKNPSTQCPRSLSGENYKKFFWTSGPWGEKKTLS
jgi:hypothetical protein